MTYGPYNRHHAFRIEHHYALAREKHPYFCDLLLGDTTHFDFPKFMLEDCRRRLACAKESEVVCWGELLDCEKYEAMVEIQNGDTAAAVEELYDCVTVLLRTIDVLEGRQRLGKPGAEGKGKAK